MKRKEILKKAGKLLVPPTLVLVSFFVAIIFLANIGEVLEKQTIDPRRWHSNVLAEADPGAGASGVLNVSIIALGSNNYNANITYNTTDWYSMHYNDSADITNNSHIGSNIPYGTAFEIQVKVQWNKTHGFNASSGLWMNDWLRGNCTCAFTTPAIGADTAMAEYNISGCTTGNYVWYYYVMNNSGAGYQLARGENATSCSFSFDAYY